MLNNKQKNPGNLVDWRALVCYNKIKVLEPIFIDYLYDYYLARTFLL